MNIATQFFGTIGLVASLWGIAFHVEDNPVLTWVSLGVAGICVFIVSKTDKKK